jgi:predicted O-methyltransferase YrrM
LFGPAVRRTFYRRRLVRELAAVAYWPAIRRSAPDLAHLAFYDDVAVGPVQRDEALFLHSIARVVRPQTVVEIGFGRAYSAFNFLTALDPEARLYSFDVDPRAARLAAERLGDDPRFRFRARSQDRLTSGDLDGRRADLVFLDGSHELVVNQATFERLLPLLAPDAIVAVHDTGTLARAFIPEGREEHRHPERWRGDEYEPQPGERAFVNWLLDAHPEFSQLHLHTVRRPRHGLTLLQRSAPLPRPA